MSGKTRAMARPRREWVPKETDEYRTLLELARGEDIYLVNYYGVVSMLCGMCGTFSDTMQSHLKNVGKNAVGIMFGGCLVVLPADVAIKNLGYLRPVGVPRRVPLVTGMGTHVYDLRKDLQGLHGGEWAEVSFDQAARDFWGVVGEHRSPKWNKTFFKFLMLETGVDLCEAEE